MKKGIIIFTTILFTFAIYTLFKNNFESYNKEELEYELVTGTNKQTIMINEEVEIYSSIVNKSPYPITLKYGGGSPFKVNIYDSNGEPLLDNAQFPIKSQIEIKQNEKFSTDSYFHTFKTKGNYKIVIEFNAFVEQTHQQLFESITHYVNVE